MAVSRLHPSPPPPTQHHQQHQQQHHHHHIASSLMSCVRESSPVEELEDAAEDSAECGIGGAGGGGGEGRKQGRHETKKRRFHPLRGLRRIFRRKSRRSPEDGDGDVLPQSSAMASSSSYGGGGGGTLNGDESRDSGGGGGGPGTGDLDEAYRSRSASELLSGEEEEEEEEGSPGGSGRRRGSGKIASGEIFQDSLRHSVSHDSVFSSGERRVSSGGGGGGGGGGRTAQPLAPSSSAQQVAAHQGVRAELFDAVRRRRWRSRSKDREEENEADRETGEAAAAGRSSDDEEDLGLPRSPCNSPSSGEAGLRSDQKEIQSKSHSTCSEGSLLSMGSSDMDEDSQGHFSGHSSKLSLHEKSSSQYGSDLELDVGVTAEPLSHSAARHKMSIRPKRTHGAPRLRRLKEVTSLGSLPTTPEVNEDSGRCSSPEISFNQETSSTEHIQASSENPHLKSASMSTAVAVEMPQRVSQGRPMASSPKSEPPLSCLPESFSSALKPFINPLLDPSLVSDKRETKELDTSTEDVYVLQTKVETTLSRNASGSATCSDADNGAVEEVIGMEESDGTGTTLLSRLLSWRGSKKKIDELPEGATAAIEGTPSRRMDVHGRYVHEIIPDMQIISSEGMDQTPPSPGWRPGPFSTSWPPIHSTPRSCHASTRYIPIDRDDRGNFSGPHSLPLMMQYGPTELSDEEKPVLERDGENRQMFSSPPSAFSVNSRNKLPPAHDEDQVDVALQKSSSFKGYKQEHVFSSSEAPESLPVRFERSEFESDYPMPSVESLIKVETSEVSMMEKEFSQKETFMMTSVEGLLTLDVSGTSEMKMCDTSEEEVSGDFDVDTDVMDGGAQEEWDRGAEEELLFNSCIMVPDDGNVAIVDSLEQKVMLHHTKMEQADEDSKCIHEKSNDLIKVESAFELTQQKIPEAQPASEDQKFSTASATSSTQRYKRTQSMPTGTTLSQPPDVPEFLRVQLIHVDSRPATNVVLHSTGGMPLPVNLSDSCDVPGRRRLRPRSADSLDGNQSGSRELVSVMPMSKSRITDVISAADNEIIGSTAGITSNNKEISIEGRCKVPIRESIGKFSQSEDSRSKETPLPCATPQSVSEEVSDRVVNIVATSSKEKEETVEQFHKALIRECSEITIQSEENRPKEATTPFRVQRKMSEDASNKTPNVPVVSMKDKEEAKFKVPVRESLGMISVQNNENRLKDASLPPKAQRKVSDESTVEVVTRRKSTVSKDLANQNPVDDLPPKAQRKVSEESLAEVVPRRKSTVSKDMVSQNKDDEPELFKVFARRSLKLKDSETWESHPPAQQQQRSRDSDKENEAGDNTMDVVILPVTKEQKQRESLIKPEFLRQIEPLVKPSAMMQTDTTPQLQRISSSNGLLQSAAVSSGNGSEKSAGVVSEIPKVHRSSIGGSLPRREGPSPEKRARGVSVNLPPESQPFRADASRGTAVSSEPRRPLWATQIHSDESTNGKTVSSDVADQTLDIGFRGEDDLKPHFKRIQQRKEEWELRARMQ